MLIFRTSSQACEVFNSTHTYTGINECTVTELRITVSDINNHAPVFSQQDYRVDDVNENIVDDSPIATIQVSDADEVKVFEAYFVS